MKGRSDELNTANWMGVIEQAAALGTWHLHLTGGEPLLRRDIEELISAARTHGLYVNLITSGLGLTRSRLEALVAAGLEHIQLSFQDCEQEQANTYAGTPAHAQKLRVAEWIHQHRIAFTVNLVVHRHNIDRLREMIIFAEQLRADKLELANVQYYGWALQNRTELLPSREQFTASLPIVEEARTRLGGKMRVDYVLPDYHAKYPKPCMGGWGRSLMLIDPAGFAMPCHSARVIPTLEFPNVAQHPLRSIWESSDVFQRFRGEAWMEEPCRSCERKTVDYGGCRCQAMLLAGNPAATDPVCSLAPTRPKVDKIVADATTRHAETTTWVYRIDPITGAP